MNKERYHATKVYFFELYIKQHKNLLVGTLKTKVFFIERDPQNVVQDFKRSKPNKILRNQLIIKLKIK